MTDSLANLTTVGSGSYAPDDVLFLLQPLQLETTAVDEKERLIQTGQKHYSEMIGEEPAPTASHMALYAQALAHNGKRMATEVQALAQALVAECEGRPLALVSLVRAGLPLGVLLRRALVDLGQEVSHYGVSIIRDRGIDAAALEVVIDAHGAGNIVFVDGWTGKGAIASELERTLATHSHFPAKPRLVVLADPCGRAWLSASSQDWLIPSGILGATISGLVSRSIWPAQGGLHGCMVHHHLRSHDTTHQFIEHVDGERRALAEVPAAASLTPGQRQALRSRADDVVNTLASRFAIEDLNRIKPGIAEATRAVLRRVPQQVLVRSRDDQDIRLLMHLADSAGVVVQEVGEVLGPYRAVTIIRSVR